MSFTQEQIDKYVDAPACPYCGSFNIDEDRQFDNETYRMACLDCEQKWMEYFALVRIAEIYE